MIQFSSCYRFRSARGSRARFYEKYWGGRRRSISPSLTQRLRCLVAAFMPSIRAGPYEGKDLTTLGWFMMISMRITMIVFMPPNRWILKRQTLLAQSSDFSQSLSYSKIPNWKSHLHLDWTPKKTWVSFATSLPCLPQYWLRSFSDQNLPQSPWSWSPAS